MIITVDKENIDIRLDQFILQNVEGYSRSYIKKWFKDSGIFVNSKKEKPSYKLKENDVVEFEIPTPEETHLVANDKIKIDVIWEDEHLAIINKPTNMVVHPGVGTGNETLVNYLVAQFGTLSNINGQKRPGIVHRLDKDTTGLMIIAKTDIAHKNIVELMNNGLIKKYYTAILIGMLPEEKLVETMIGKSFKNQIKMTVNGVNPKPAKTLFKPIKYLGNIATLVEVRIFTGRTHQIRVHANHIGYSVLGDKTYNASMNFLEHKISKSNLDKLRKALKNIDRQALSATKLEFPHPITNEELKFEINPPEDILNVIKILE